MSLNAHTPLPKIASPLARPRLRRFAAPALIAILSVLAVWPTAFNRGALLFVDSFDVLQAADAGIAKAVPSFGRSGFFKTKDELLASHRDRAERGGGRPVTTSPPGGSSKVAPVVIGGRSVYYGLPADIALRLGGLWIWALAQAAVGVGLLWLTCAHFGLNAASRATSILFAIALTSFPIYASLMLPDVWAGYAILSVCALSVFGKAMSRGETAFHLAVVTFGCLSHNSIILMILATGLALGAPQAIRLLRRRLRRGGLRIATAPAASRLRLPAAVIVCGLAVAAGLAGGKIYTYIVKASLGASTDNPPFLTARLSADGPGRKYLQHHCYGAHFYICKMRTPIPGDSQTFLWAPQNQGGIWVNNSPEARNQISKQDIEFALAVTLHEPAGVFFSSIGNAARQVVTIDAEDILGYSAVEKAIISALEPKYINEIARSRAFTGSWPKTMIGLEEMLLMIASFAGIVVMNLRRDVWSDPVRKFANRALLFIVVNATACGCVSGVFGRYQGRVVWVMAWVVFVSFLCAPSIRTLVKPRRPTLTPPS